MTNPSCNRFLDGHLRRVIHVSLILEILMRETSLLFSPCRLFPGILPFIAECRACARDCAALSLSEHGNDFDKG